MSRLIIAKQRDDNPSFWHRCDGPATKDEKKLLEVKHVQGPTVAWARKNGCRAVKVQGPGNRSQPDYMFLIPGGRPFFIEFKRPGEVPTELQTHTIHEYVYDGYDIEVHDSKVSAIKAILERLSHA